MAVEKMSLVSVSGPLKQVNKALVRCCETKCFHLEPNYYTLTYGSAQFRTLKDKDIYRHLIKRAEDIAAGLGIEDKSVAYDGITMETKHEFDEYFRKIEDEVGDLISVKGLLDDSIDQYQQALRHIQNLSNLDTDFKDIISCKHVKVRFGRMPSDSYTKLEFYSDKDFVFVPLDENDGYVWGVYFAPIHTKSEADDIFNGLYFERIRIPDYVTGDGETALADLTHQIAQLKQQREEVLKTLRQVREREYDYFLKVRSKLRFLDSSYEMRDQVTVINNRFHMAGFIPTKKLKMFKETLSTVTDVEVEDKPYFIDERMKPPTKLRNNWLFRPFEMFVKMYGLPAYNGIDPTPYVAITFMLLYGIMFGDLGQGIVISLLGFILDRWKKVKLAPIMMRIGISSAIFGTLYGSVFGNEELITPFFHAEPFSTLMGHPHNIFQASTYLLIAALVIGVLLIVISMILNITLSIKRQDYESAFFGANGITGMVFYVAVLVAAALQLALGIPMFTPLYIVFLILLPLCIMFFKEPLAHIVASSVRGNVLQIKKVALANTALRASDRLDEADAKKLRKQLDYIQSMKNVRAVYGRMPAEAQMKLEYHKNNDYAFVPVSEKDGMVYGVYFTPKSSKAKVDEVFLGLSFERLKMPSELSNPKRARAASKQDKPNATKEKKSVGNMIVEGFIELFETCLSYLTNTMSFLRVGGFILSHAGMMLVVNVLAGSELSAGSIIVQILGNLFVIGMEGFIVGIQVLRLEFYELFGRFYVSDGKEFTPLQVNV